LLTGLRLRGRFAHQRSSGRSLAGIWPDPKSRTRAARSGISSLIQRRGCAPAARDVAGDARDVGDARYKDLARGLDPW
jgi:hypothetical protein